MTEVRRAIIAGALAGCIPAAAMIFYKPKPIVVAPQTTVIAGAAKERTGATPTKTEARKISAAWGDLAQPEVDALTAELKKISKSNVVVFCIDDDKCGDLALDLENAFESAHWTIKVEKPFFDDTLGIATSREDLRAAIEKATSGRLKVKMIPQVTPQVGALPGSQVPPIAMQPDVIALGKKPK